MSADSADRQSLTSSIMNDDDVIRASCYRTFFDNGRSLLPDECPFGASYFADHGFVYAGDDFTRDCVQCHECAVRLSRWRPGDDVVDRHGRESLHPCEQGGHLLQRELRDPTQPTSDDAASVYAAVGQSETLASSSYLRERTFRSSSPTRTATKLASAGFVEVEGRGDALMCASCLLLVETADDPAALHRRLSPQCIFSSVDGDSHGRAESSESPEAEPTSRLRRQFDEITRRRQATLSCRPGTLRGQTCADPRRIPTAEPTLAPFLRWMKVQSCSICLEQVPSCCLKPCGHVATCADEESRCFERLRECPICKTDIESKEIMTIISQNAEGGDVPTPTMSDEWAVMVYCTCKEVGSGGVAVLDSCQHCVCFECFTKDEITKCPICATAIDSFYRARFP